MSFAKSGTYTANISTYHDRGSTYWNGYGYLAFFQEDIKVVNISNHTTGSGTGFTGTGTVTFTIPEAGIYELRLVSDVSVSYGIGFDSLSFTISSWYPCFEPKLEGVVTFL